MDNQYYRQGDKNGFQYLKNQNNLKESGINKDKAIDSRKRDEDLVIEENTVYEIDRDCYERLKSKKKRK